MARFHSLILAVVIGLFAASGPASGALQCRSACGGAGGAGSRGGGGGDRSSSGLDRSSSGLDRSSSGGLDRSSSGGLDRSSSGVDRSSSGGLDRSSGTAMFRYNRAAAKRFETVEKQEVDEGNSGLPGSNVSLCGSSQFCWDCCLKDGTCIQPCTGLDLATGNTTDASDSCGAAGGSCAPEYCCFDSIFPELKP